MMPNRPYQSNKDDNDNHNDGDNYDWTGVNIKD